MKRKSKRRTPKVSYLKKKLDRVFSVYIRLRDSDESGFCSCITCGAINHWKEVDAGHFYNRDRNSTRYHENNVHAQCRSCNRYQSGETAKYGYNLMNKYDMAILKELNDLQSMYKKWKTYELEELINSFKEKIRKILEKKSIEIDEGLTKLCN